MEPLVASSSSAVLRPAAAALQSDLAAVLRDGRVLAGQLVSGSTDGQVLLAIGRHHVPAQSDVRLEPGRPFLFRVEETASGVVLHVLDGAGGAEPALLGALREVVAHERPLGEILSALAARIRATADAPGSGRAGASEGALLRSLLTLLGGHVAGEGADGAALRELLARSGLRYESQLLALARAASGPDEAAHAALAARVQGDLKGELLRFFARLGDPGLGEEVARALAGLEAEQLFNVARERAGDPLVWSLVIPDGSRWTTLRLALSARGEREGQGQERHGAGLRLVLGLSLSNTGPLRVDLFLSPEALSVRLLVERADVAERLAADAERIAELLATEGRGVHVSARHASPAEVAFAERPLDIRWLDRHHLMDVQG